MYNKLIKGILFLMFILLVSNRTFAQSFYDEYNKYLISQFGKKITSANKSAIDERLDLLKQAIQANENKNKRSFFQNDTLYIVSFRGVETGFVSAVVWNKTTSCYYKFLFGDGRNRKYLDSNIDIKPDASDILKSFTHDFRNAIETGNTTAYYNYTKKHEVFDGEWVSPMMCIKKNGHWEFIRFNDTGQPINYDFELPKRN